MLAKLLRLAVKHLTTNPDGESSARHCLAMARYMETEGNAEAAEMWARKSLAHSIGITHAEYPH